MKVKDQLRIALVGCGRVAQAQHIPSLLKMKNTRLVALCDENEATVRATAQKFRIKNWYSDFSEMLKKEGVDIVDICTPPQTHLPLFVLAARAGCHVLMEKPVALSVREFDEMTNVLQNCKVKFCPVHNKQFEPILLKATDVVRKGSPGMVVGIHISVLHAQKRTTHLLADRGHWCHSLPGGIFAEVLPHPIYLANAFLGRVEPVGIHTRKSSSYDWVVADEITIVLKGKKGMGIIYFSPTSAQSKTIIDIYGTEKHLRIDLLNSVMTEYGSGTGTRLSRALENLGQGLSILSNTIASTLSVASGKFHSGHYTLIERFIDSIRDDTEPPVTLQAAREATEVFEKVITRV